MQELYRLFFEKSLGGALFGGECLVVAIVGNLAAHNLPDHFLRIQSGLIRRQKQEAQSRMRSAKSAQRFGVVETDIVQNKDDCAARVSV